jgi:hypothetical protein
MVILPKTDNERVREGKDKQNIKMSNKSKMNKSKAMEIINRRKAGIYMTEETMGETELAFKQMTPSDVAITIRHCDGMFNVMNLAEMLPQIQRWKALGCVVRKCNTKNIKVGDKDAVMWILQPSDKEIEADNVPMSPLALAYGMMVNGYAYISKDEKIVELLYRVLGNSEDPGKVY